MFLPGETLEVSSNNSIKQAGEMWKQQKISGNTGVHVNKQLANEQYGSNTGLKSALLNTIGEWMQAEMSNKNMILLSHLWTKLCVPQLHWLSETYWVLWSSGSQDSEWWWTYNPRTLKTKARRPIPKQTGCNLFLCEDFSMTLLVPSPPSSHSYPTWKKHQPAYHV